jgi:Tetratricopeptide repeat
MTGNIKNLTAYLTISLAVLGAASVERANGAGDHESEQGGKGADGDTTVRIYSGGRIGGDDGDGIGDARRGEFGPVARPRTIIPGSGMVRSASGIDARPRVNMASSSFGSPNFGAAPVANFGQAGVNNGGLGLQGTAYGQGTGAPNTGTAPMGGTNAAPEGVYNQFGFGVTAAAVNSADPFNRSPHENRPNMIDADAYNNQFVHWSYGLASYYGGYGGSGGYGGYENGYSPFLFDSSLYYRRGPSYNNAYDNYAVYGSGAFEYRSLNSVVAQPAVYEYSHPLTTPVTPPQPAVANPVGTGFDASRDAFKAGNYSKALELADQSIRQLPGDGTLHEFRGLVLFALQRYEDAAAPLHTALSVGRGWDWRTLVGLYSNVSVYTEQLRALENHCNQNPRSASARFVLAYLYLTQGNADVAADQFKQVRALQPENAVAARLIQQLDKTKMPAGSDRVRPE